jgi:hypothetical protein
MTMRRSACASLFALALLLSANALADDFTANPGGHWK